MFDLYNIFKYGSLNKGINSVIRDFIIEAVMPLLNFIFFVSSNREMIFGKESSEDKTLDTFLSSSLNVELVYVTLTSIVEFVKDRQFWSNKQTGEFLNTSLSQKPVVQNFSLVNRRKETLGSNLKSNQIEPSILILPFIKLQTSLKFWEKGDESIRREKFYYDNS